MTRLSVSSLSFGVLALSCTLAGCGGGTETGASGASKSSPSSSGAKEAALSSSGKVKEVKAENVSPTDLAAQPKVRKAEGARSDVTLKGCPSDKSGATASGLVKNSTGEATDYAITISWVNGRSDVRTRAAAVVRDVKPGERRRWKVDAPAHSGIETCTVFVQRGDAA